MATFSLQSTNFHSTMLPFLDSISLLINPYKLISDNVHAWINNTSNFPIVSFTLTLTIIHGFISVQLILVICLKIYRQRTEGKSLSPWRKGYRPNHELAYLVPNGSFSNDILQILGSILLQWFVISGYRAFKFPESVSDISIPLGAFCIAVTSAPGFVSLWWNGWSCIYVGFITPYGGQSKNPVYRLLQHPLVMNSVCMGTPILVTFGFVGLGINLFNSIKKILDSYVEMMNTLAQFSASWKPNDPSSLQKNRNIWKIFLTLAEEGNHLGDLLQVLAYSLAAVSLLIVMFYLIATFALGKAIKQVVQLRESSEKNCFHNDRTDDSKDTGTQSDDGFVNQIHLKETIKLQRNYYSILASSCIMSLALSLNVATWIIVGMKAKLIFYEPNLQIQIASLATSTSILVSCSTLIQSILLIWKERQEYSMKQTPLDKTPKRGLKMLKRNIASL